MAEAGRILIVGGGIAGLSLAIALRRNGAAAELVERSPAWPAVGAGIALHANAVRALRALGLGEAIETASAPLPRWGFFDRHGTRLCQTDLADLWREVGPCLGITRIRLHEILVTAAAGVPCRLGVALTGLTQDGDRVSASFADGSAGDYDLVVGADGIHSAVRRLAVSPIPPQYADTVSWRSVIPARPPGTDHLMIFTGERCFFGLVPVDEGSTYGFAAWTESASTIRQPTACNGSSSGSGASAGRSRPTSPRCSTTTRSTSGRSNGSNCAAGTPAGWS